MFPEVGYNPSLGVHHDDQGGLLPSRYLGLAEPAPPLSPCSARDAESASLIARARDRSTPEVARTVIEYVSNQRHVHLQDGAPPWVPLQRIDEDIYNPDACRPYTC